MKYNAITDFVLLALNGGQFSDEAPIQEQEVRAYIPVAAHKAIHQFVIASMAQARQSKMSGEFESFSLPPELYRTYEIKTTTLNGHVVIELPRRPQAWVTGARPIILIQNDKRTYEIALGTPATKSITRGKSAWVEYGVGTNLIFLNGVPSGCTMLVTAALEIEPIMSNSNEAEIDIPSSIQDDIVKICIDHFRMQLSTPGDLIVDNTQTNEQGQ